MLTINFYNSLNQLPTNIPLVFSVICARTAGKWVLVQHKTRTTYELPGGHIESNEHPDETAKRELYEETGASEFTLSFVAAYTVTRGSETRAGCLYFAEVTAFDPLPDSEIASIHFFDILPADLTYPEIQPQLFYRVQMWLNVQTSKAELWDVYDSDRNLTGRRHRRGDPLPPGDYHLVVHVWVMNQKGELLITKRTPNKGFPNMWECTGGSALAGDDSETAAKRELLEETGLALSPDNKGICISTITREESFCDVWLFHQEANLSDLTLQQNETCDAQWATPAQIRQMRDEGIFMPFSYLDDFLNKLEAL